MNGQREEEKHFFYYGTSTLWLWTAKCRGFLLVKNDKIKDCPITKHDIKYIKCNLSAGCEK
jgi:hypothetical protein